MLGALGEHERVAAFPDGRQDVVADQAVAPGAGGEFLIELLELDALVRIGGFGGPEAGRTNDHLVGERTGRGLGPGIDPVADRARTA